MAKRIRAERCYLCDEGEHLVHSVHGGSEITLIRGGRRAYLTVDLDDAITHFDDPEVLRALALAILEELGKE